MQYIETISDDLASGFVDAESVLRSTNMKFKKRFAFVEQSAKSQGRNLSDMTLEEMDAFWNQAKKMGL